MTAAELLAHLERLEVRVWAEGDQLRLSAPKGAISPELRAMLVERKAELLALLGSAPGSGDSSPSGERAAHAQGESYEAPLSSGQEGMWFFEQLQNNAANQLNVGLQLDGVLHTDALRQALQGLVQRHASLRTTFRSHDDGPVQVVAATGTVDFEVRAAGTPSMVDAALVADAARPFDLERGPLLRALLLVLGPERHILLLTLHHIITDGWSLAVLLRELPALYDAAVQRVGSPLGPLPMQYADYARWQREQLAGGALEPQLAYWRQQLRGPLPVLELPTDHPRPAVEAHSGERINFAMSAVAASDLNALARREHATPFMVLLAGFTALLSRYTGQDDLIVGTPVAGRSRPEWEGLIGLFMNTLVLRTNTGADPEFLALLRRVRDTSINAYEHQDVPFERLVEELRPARDPGRNPLFQVMFDVQSVMPPPPFAGLEMKPVAVDRGAAQLDLTLSVLISEGRLHAQWEFNTDLFDRGTIEQLAHRYEQLLASAVADPTQRISQLSMLTADDAKQLSRAWEGIESEYVATHCIHTLLEESARAEPASAAIIAGEETLSYGELDARANRLAHLLVRRGVSPGDRVAVCLDRTVELPVALAAVLKVGAAYVPLDPTHPADRLRYTVEDADVGCILTLAGFGARFDGARAPLVILDEVAAEVAAQPTTPVSVETKPDSLAYVIYTSGSTGRPKGVEVAHGNVVGFLAAMRATPGCTPHDVVLAVTTIAFDIAGLELWLPLSVGARVVLAARSDALDGERLGALLAQHGVTLLQATPATWRLLLDAGWAGTPTLTALCGGEALPRELAAALVPRVGALWNMYGPTETTIWSTLSHIPDAAAPITIGRPIAGTRVYVLEPSGQLAPAGVPGELCIAGAGVARGYHHRPALTAEKFTPLRLPGGRTERVYHTGDVVRARPDGQLEYRGRRDDQIKLRGYRIELGEIETTIARTPGVRQCAVALRADRLGDPRLVAYVKYAPGEDLTASEVRMHLRRELPEYMIPSVIAALDTVPLTPNGKVDRAALPDPFGSTPRTGAAHVPPSPGAEQTLAEIWRELLSVDTISAEDNFFELGGHSLLSLRVVAAVKKRLGWRMDPRVLFFQSLRQVAADAPPHDRDGPKGRTG